jgi:Tfp pilus assembly PilM family ATPase/Tfp pilus assembly protein PilN
MGIFNFLKKQKQTVVLELAEKYFKIACLKAPGKKNSGTDVNAVYDDNLTDETVISGIKDFFKNNNISKNTNFICVIPSSYGIYKNVEIPTIDKKEINQIIDLQAGSHTPYPKNEIVLDYAQTGVIYERYSKILLVILKRDVVAKRYSIASKLGCAVEEVVLGSEVVSKYFSEILQGKGSRPYGVVHIDSVLSDFTIMQNESCVYIRSIPVGMHELKSNPAESLHVFLEELKKSMEAYQANSVADMPDKIYTIGEESLAQSLVIEIKKLFSIETLFFNYTTALNVTGNVFDKIAQNKDVSFLPVLAPLLLKNKNRLGFAPEDIKLQNEIKKSSNEMMRFGVLAAVLFLLFCCVLLTKIALKDQYLKKISSSYTQEEDAIKKIENISQRTRVVKEFLRRKGDVLNVLSELMSSMPEEVYLSSIKYANADTLTFTGTASSMSRVFSLVTELEGNQSFKNVKVDFTRTRKQAGEEVADFGLTLNIEGIV